MLASGEELRGDARANFERVPDPPPRPFEPAALEGAGAIVDAILGTGFSGEPRDPARSAIESINEAAGDAVVVACDVPSGVDASTGEVAGQRGVGTRHGDVCTLPSPASGSRRERHTPAMSTVVDIGIPPGAPVAADGRADRARSRSTGFPHRDHDSTKFAAGAVLVCGGSTGLTGAPCLA